MGISLRALAPAMGISVPSLFGYRSGKIPISGKAWSKLDHTEKEQELALHQLYGAIEDAVMREDATPYRFTPKDRPAQKQEPQAHELQAVLERIAKALEKLVEIEENKNSKQ